MHGVPGAWHAFLKLNECGYLSFVEMPQNRDIEPSFGLSHAQNPRSPSAPGTMQHVAFNVADDETLLAMRDRIRDRGINVMGPVSPWDLQFNLFCRTGKSDVGNHDK